MCGALRGLKGEVELKDGVGSGGVRECLLCIIRICILLTGDNDEYKTGCGSLGSKSMQFTNLILFRHR